MEGLGVKIRKRQKELNLTQSEVAGNRMSIAKLSNIENGKVKPDPGCLKYLQEKLHLPELSNMEHSKEKVLFLMDQSLTYLHSGLKEQAKDKLVEVQNKAYESLFLSIWSEAKQLLAQVHLDLREWSESLEHIAELEAYFEGIGDRQGLAWCLDRRGTISFLQKKYMSAIQKWNRALDWVEEHDRCYRSQLLYQLAKVYYHLHDFDHASLYCEKAILEGEGLLSANVHDFQRLQGLLLYRSGMYQLAKEKLLNAKAIAMKVKDYEATAKCWHYVGAIEMQLHHWDEAHQCLQLSYEIKEKHGYLIGMAHTKCLIGLLKGKKGQEREALEDIMAAIKVLEEHEIDTKLIFALECLCEVYVLNQKYREAIEPIDQAIKLAEDYSLTGMLKDLYEQMARLYDMIGENEACLTFLYKGLEIPSAIEWRIG